LSREVRLIYRSLWVALGVVALGIALAVVVSARISRPLRRLSEASAAITRFDLARVPVLEANWVRELDVAAHAFNAMRTTLHWFQQYVPRTVVRRLVEEQASVEPEERVVTIMFTDIAGFSKLASDLAPQELAQLLNRHFAMVNACVEATGGMLDKFIGDGSMSFWDSEAYPDDHADRACEAALALSREHSTADSLFSFRVGIHTGKVLIGNIGGTGRVNFTLIGDSVNIAQRIEQYGKNVVSDINETVVLTSEDTLAATIKPKNAGEVGRYSAQNNTRSLAVFRLFDTAGQAPT
jgi:adenylate cyclase